MKILLTDEEVAKIIAEHYRVNEKAVEMVNDKENKDVGFSISVSNVSIIPKNK